mgnify:CR=1 FL=1
MGLVRIGFSTSPHFPSFYPQTYPLFFLLVFSFFHFFLLLVFPAIDRQTQKPYTFPHPFLITTTN